jgi:molybdate transport system substrate-binding protein
MRDGPAWAASAILLWLGACLPARAEPLLVFAAASLTETLDAVGEAYAAAGHDRPTFSYAASSALARQIESGAPAALFVSADESWMDYLAARNLIVPPSRVSLLGNSLVLVAPADRPLALAIGPGFPLAATLGPRKLALADPDAVPAGRYAKAALEALGVWPAVEKAVVRAENVRAALTFVERGEVAAGIVYATDAALARKVQVVGSFPADSHPPISYPVAIVAGRDGPAAQAFRAFLLSAPAKAIYRRFGFTAK